MTAESTLTAARAVADAVLYEGYLLYPYRATAGKNQVRWQFGIVGPPGAVAAGAGEEPTMSTECLLAVDDADDHDGADGAVVDVHVRFLQAQVRAVERATDDETFVAADELTVGDTRWVRWHEAVERELTFADLPLDGLEETRRLAVEVPGGTDVELLRDDTGEVVGRLVRTRSALTGWLELSATPVPGVDRLRTLRAHLENDTSWQPGADRVDKPRDEAARSSFVGTHLLLVAHGAQFVSLTDPPSWAAEAASACTNHRCWPVLVGPEGSRDVVLASPIILPDHPTVAPESPGDLYDSTEIDEILTLRIMTLTDDEKIAARGTDPRAAAIIDRSDALPPEVFERLHGALRSFDPQALDSQPFDPHSIDGAPIDQPRSEDGRAAAAAAARLARPVPDAARPAADRPDLEPPAAQVFDPEIGALDFPTYGPKPKKPWWDPGVDASVSPDSDTVLVGDVVVSKGSRVRLAPQRRADAHDLFLAGHTAVVAGVFFDVDGETHVAVTLEDDPASEFHDWYGRYYYFGPEEIEPLVASEPGAVP